MTYLTDIPRVIVKPGRMLRVSRLALAALLLALLLYGCALVYIKDYYLKSKRLDHIDDLTKDLEKRMMRLHSRDKKLAVNTERLGKNLHMY